ncbi:hypothetical protein QBC43DRAFT_290257 [Cladorrhinum sp. PSN259]|nr:hypothetical protein QBC43DRAFT_290257 [Cladorrhinum sp. PSN259]
MTRADGNDFLPQYEPREALVSDFCQRNRLSPTALTELKNQAGEQLPPFFSDMAWKAEDIQSRHITFLSNSERNEVSDACAAFVASGKSLNDLDKSLFPLPLLATRLAAIRKDLHQGLGLAVLRGIGRTNMSTVAEIFTTFAGISSHIAPQRAKQARNNMIVHITHMDKNSGSLPAPYLNGPLPFHTDPAADVVAMFVIHPASNCGGDGLFAPVASIYNHLAATRPDLLHELLKPDWPFAATGSSQQQSNGDNGDADGNGLRRAVMFLSPISGAPEMLFSRGALITRSHRAISEKQNAALDAAHFAAETVACRVQYHAGDLLFFNNRRILHAREGFTDNAMVPPHVDIGRGVVEGGDGGHDDINETKKRHMLRLWLGDRELAGTPPGQMLQQVWRDAFDRNDDDHTSKPHVKKGGKWPAEPTCD